MATEANGKGTYLMTISKIVGDYHCESADRDVHRESNIDRHPTDLAMLRGARLVTSDGDGRRPPMGRESGSRS